MAPERQQKASARLKPLRNLQERKLLGFGGVQGLGVLGFFVEVAGFRGVGGRRISISILLL